MEELPDEEITSQEDDDEAFDAADHGDVVVERTEELDLYLAACAVAAEAGL